MEWGRRDWEDQAFRTLFDLSWSLLFTKLHQHSLLGCGNTLCLVLLKVMAARKRLPKRWRGCSWRSKWGPCPEGRGAPNVESSL